MVATRRDRVAFALGQTSLNGQRLTSQELVKIVRELIEMIEPKHVRGFTSLHNILLGKKNQFDEGKLMQTESAAATAALGECKLPPSAMFHDLGSILSFPDKPPVVKLRKPGLRYKCEVRAHVHTARLLLSRKGDVWLLRVVRKPVLERESEPNDYKYVVDKVKLEVLSDDMLSQVFAHYRKQYGNLVLGERTVLMLYAVQYSTSDALKSDARYAARCTRKIARVVERLGFGMTRGEDE
ncbi:hypothetical protein HYW59_04960 [Candidatus Kaiserbacteria bacterium]|nr:hypothetical protein [Candidatus Kaiserbacteria bacterium]